MLVFLKPYTIHTHLPSPSSQVVLIPEEPEDMWHVYNLIALGDSVKSTTIRKVKDESATGSSTTSRVRTTLTLSVEAIDFDTSSCELRVKGRNIQENQYVKVRTMGVKLVSILSFCVVGRWVPTTPLTCS